jgi:hypothetical protein
VRKSASVTLTLMAAMTIPARGQQQPPASPTPPAQQNCQPGSSGNPQNTQNCVTRHGGFGLHGIFHHAGG